MPLPDTLNIYFWDCDIRSLSWTTHRDFITRRLLQYGSWEALSWLRAEMGDAELRRWIELRGGAGLNPRQLRFWELTLDLPHAKVNQWVSTARQNPWGQRSIS
jgi:hypothetical protein